MNFSLGAVLSVVGEKLMTDMTEIYDILNYLTNDNLFTHQLPRAQRECQPYILRQFPFLQEYVNEIEPTITKENYGKILFDCQEKWGRELDVKPIPPDDHSKRDPLGELTQMMDGTDKIIVIDGENKGK